ncbi:RNA polymerase II transcription factor B subunit 1 [Leucoagaricus gongylophorus]
MGSFANEPRIDYYAYYSVYGKSILQKTPWTARTHRFSSAMDSRKWKVTIDTPPQDRVVFKEGAPQVRLKVALFTDENGHNFTFVSPNARNEREKFKKELTGIVSINKTAAEAGSRGLIASPPVPITATPTHKTSNFNAPTPRVLGRVPLPPSRAASVASERVLMSNLDLATLHKDLVIGGQITEAEFWDGREHLLLAQAAADNQQKGKSGQLVDPRPETVEGGEIKIRITPQLVHDIFDEYPVVAMAYSENVPNKLTEEQFWKRYFQSKLFNAHRASIRSSATQHVVKDDEIFDKYLERDDDELEPRRQRSDPVQAFIDLAATLEDHGETGNEKDITMQAGRQKAALPLIRKFNEHSERLLNSALGEVHPTKRRRLDPGEDPYSYIEFDDLHNVEASAGILLEMKDRQRYFEGQVASRAVEDADATKSLYHQTVHSEIKLCIQKWDTNLTELKIERKAGDSALINMTQNVATLLDVKSRKNSLSAKRVQRNDIPNGLFRQMIACQTAANEFLRQFWSAIYPSPVDSQSILSIATPAQRAAKATKMIGYLSKTPEKVEALVRVAQQHGVSGSKVETAMRPMLNAVDRALNFQRNKKPQASPV